MIVKKYILNPAAPILDLPVGARFMHAGITTETDQGAWGIAMWFQVSEFALGASECTRTVFAVIGTDHEIPPEHRHLITIFNDPYAWHVFAPVAPIPMGSGGTVPCATETDRSSSE